MQANTIAEVIQVLDGIIADCRATSDPLGYFAVLYRAITLRVQAGIAAGFFDDGPRMDRFDTAFANRYFAAYDAFRANGTPSKCWKVTFRTTVSGTLIILQDLLLGVNAHINFDLSVTAADAFSPTSLNGFRGDFDRINDIVAAILPQVEDAVGRVSPILGILAAVGGQPATETLDFSIAAARSDAWLHATVLAGQPTAARAAAEHVLDTKVAFLGRVVARPAWPVAAAVDVVAETEEPDVATVMSALLSVA